MPPNVARFHVATGPKSLFTRVRQVFHKPRPLNLHGAHLADRTARRGSPPPGDLELFDPSAWKLVLVEARTDTGRFVSTTWSRRYDTEEWWVVIGFQDTVRTVYRVAHKRGLGRTVVTGGPLWDMVDEVNAALVRGS